MTAAVFPGGQSFSKGYQLNRTISARQHPSFPPVSSHLEQEGLLVSTIVDVLPIVAIRACMSTEPGCSWYAELLNRQTAADSRHE